MNVTQVAAAGKRAGTAGVKDTRARDIALLGALVLVTRVPLIGPFESDSALFLIGVRQWLRGGPDAIAIYSAYTCSFYYSSIVFLIRAFHLPQYSYHALMSTVSVAAGVGIVILGYLLGRRVVGPTASASAMVLFALSPGLWWITIEPHPQSSSLFFSLLAALLLVRFLESRRWPFVAAAVASYALALAVKNDAVLLAPALLSIALWVRPRWSGAVAACGVVAAGGIGYLLLVHSIVGSSHRVVTSGAAAARYSLLLPNFTGALKQIVPDIFGFGIVSALALAFVVPKVLFRNPERCRLLLLVLLWTLPGYVFWFFSRGNNTRHVVGFELPILWIGALWLQGKLLWACAVLSFLIPANSNPGGVFPSPNVPVSVRKTAAKVAYLDELATELAATNSCFIGSYTNDYIADALMRSGATVAREDTRGDLIDLILVTPAKTEVALRRTDPWFQKKVLLGGCRSVEYDHSGQKVRYLGDEWHIHAM